MFTNHRNTRSIYTGELCLLLIKQLQLSKVFTFTDVILHASDADAVVQVTIIRGAMFMDISSWNSSLHAYGIRICETCNTSTIQHQCNSVLVQQCMGHGHDETVWSSA